MSRNKENTLIISGKHLKRTPTFLQGNTPGVKVRIHRIITPAPYPLAEDNRPRNQPAHTAIKRRPTEFQRLQKLLVRDPVVLLTKPLGCTKNKKDQDHFGLSPKPCIHGLQQTVFYPYMVGHRSSVNTLQLLPALYYFAFQARRIASTANSFQPLPGYFRSISAHRSERSLCFNSPLRSFWIIARASLP